MKLLIATPYIPYPLSHGGSVAQYHIIDFIRNYIDVTLFLIVTTEREKKDVSDLKEIWKNVNFEVIDLAQTTNRSQKIINYIKQFRKKTGNNNQTISVQSDVTLYWPRSEAFINGFTEIINRIKPDLIQVDFLSFIDLVLVIPKNIKSVFVHHELRFAKMESIMKTQTTISELDKYYYNETKTREIAFLNLYDAVFVFSSIDKLKINSLAPNLKLLVSPFGFGNFNLEKKDFAIDNTVKKIIFIGGESHSANVDGIQWYISEILQELNKISSLPLHVIGNWKKNTVEKYKSSQIHFDGFVDDLSIYSKDSIMIVPIRIGSGIRTKILDAMALGIPLVTTLIGCEGINGLHNKDFLIGDSPKEFAKMVHKLEIDTDFRKKMIVQAYQTVKNYSSDNAGELRLKYLKEIIN